MAVCRTRPKPVSTSRSFERYVEVQSESAVRHLANCYPYDHGEEDEMTFRSGVDEVSQALQRELQDRVNKAGVAVEEARLTHLAYAPEIADAMLRRQQAEAIIAARQKIVHGAVSMVEMALNELAEKRVVELDEERKAAMVSNLLVVFCGEQRSPSGDQRGNAVPVDRSHEVAQVFSFTHRPGAVRGAGSLGAAGVPQRQRPDRIPAARGGRARRKSSDSEPTPRPVRKPAPPKTH